MSSPQHTNRLSRETSPYLLQHAHNPVDWYPWGPEALAAARSADKPIFLSVGYSTCYWCHVMERQCFENEAIAALMNDLFVNVKVDREERPDVDQLYMTAVQVLTRHGGWPMSVFLTPQLKPFFGGTYFPPEDAHGRPGFPTVLRAISDAYQNRRAEAESSADQLVSILARLARPHGSSQRITIDAEHVEDLVARSVADYEPRFGGFGSAPKFPRETLLELLLTYCAQHPQGAHRSRVLGMVQYTLDAMANGGIRDHLGGGFHRYSTDSRWLVPHFEIMLYDNAMLAWCYIEAYRQTKETRYASVARDVLNFVMRRMSAPSGGFYTAFDAEVDAREGEPYLWTPQEVGHVLGPDDARLFNRIYGLDRGPNFADPHHGNGTPEKNVLYLPEGPPSEEDERRLLAIRARTRLLEARQQRKQPLLDTKIITSWNALMIRALAHGGKVLQDAVLIESAGRAADFLLRHHRREDGTLYRTSRNGAAKHDGFLDDYAFLAQALLALHDANAPGQLWKDHAASVAQAMVRKFAARDGGFYFSQESADDLIVRQMVGSDSPLPSGNAVAAMVMLQLGQQDVARDTLKAFVPQLEVNAEGMSAMLQAAVGYVQSAGPIEIEPVAGAADADEVLSPHELAGRVVSVQAAWRDKRTLELRLRILRGFHIQSSQAPKELVSTAIRAGDSSHPIAAIDYPPGEVYEGEVPIVIRFRSAIAGQSPLRFALTYQACDDSACLPAVTKELQIPILTP